MRWLVFSITSILGLFLTLYFWNRNTGLVIVGLMLFVTGLKFLYDTIRAGKAQYDPLVRTLSFEKEKIVWVYAIQVDNMPFGIQLVSNGRVVLRTSDDVEFNLSIPPRDVNPLLDILKGELTHATFGFSNQKKQLYHIDPYLLYRDDEPKNGDKLSF